MVTPLVIDKEMKMKKALVAALVGLSFAGSAFAEEITLGSRDFVEDMGNGVVLHKHYDPRTKEWTSEYKVLDKDYTFIFANGDKQTIGGANDYKATKEGLDAAMNGRPNGEDGMNRPIPGTGGEVERPHPGDNNRPFPGTGIDRPEANPDVDEGFGVVGKPVERPLPGNGIGSVERPRPGVGEGSVDRPRPEGDNASNGGAGGDVNRPMPEKPDNSVVVRPTPGLGGAVANNTNSIQQMGAAFEQRVDKVDGWMNKTDSTLRNHTNAINDMGNALKAESNYRAREIARLDGRIDRLEEKTDKLKAGVAGAHAVASLTQYTGKGIHHVAIGIGGYEGESALAGGYTFAITDNTTIRGTVAYDSQGDFGYGVSVGHSW